MSVICTSSKITYDLYRYTHTKQQYHALHHWCYRQAVGTILPPVHMPSATTKMQLYYSSQQNTAIAFGTKNFVKFSIYIKTPQFNL